MNARQSHPLWIPGGKPRPYPSAISSYRKALRCMANKHLIVCKSPNDTLSALFVFGLCVLIVCRWRIRNVSWGKVCHQSCVLTLSFLKGVSYQFFLKVYKVVSFSLLSLFFYKIFRLQSTSWWQKRTFLPSLALHRGRNSSKMPSPLSQVHQLGFFNLQSIHFHDANKLLQPMKVSLITMMRRRRCPVASATWATSSASSGRFSLHLCRPLVSILFLSKDSLYNHRPDCRHLRRLCYLCGIHIRDWRHHCHHRRCRLLFRLRPQHQGLGNGHPVCRPGHKHTRWVIRNRRLKCNLHKHRTPICPPDTFASMIAAKHDEGADNCIGNVTGSNAVNVFLGIGLAWTIAAVYHSSHGMTFNVEPGTWVVL